MPRRDEHGAGLLPAVFGVAIIVSFLGLAAHVAIALWTRTTIDAVAYDAARRVATAPEGADESIVRSEAIERAKDMLGGLAGEVELRFEDDSENIVLFVDAPGRFVIGDLERRIVVRRETS